MRIDAMILMTYFDALEASSFYNHTTETAIKKSTFTSLIVRWIVLSDKHVLTSTVLNM